MKKAIVAASFGTSYEETRSLTLDVIEKEIAEIFTGYEVVKTYTSSMVRGILERRDGIKILSPEETVSDLKQRGFEKIFIQPTHVIPGEEYEKLIIPGTILGSPLLTDNADWEKIVEALELTQPQESEAIVFMGHGSYHGSDKFYEIIEAEIREHGFKNIFAATVEGARRLEHVIPQLKVRGIKKVKLLPFMIVAGDHAINDMASEEDESWNSVLKHNGFQTEPILKGLGELPKIRELIYKSLKNLIYMES